MKASEFEQRIADFMRDNEMLDSAPRVLLAVSGGADSTAMLHALCALRTRGLLNAELTCAHVNHRLRGERGDDDERFVVRRAEKLGLEVKIKRVDVRSFARRAGLSIETAARQLRIESLLDIARETGCSLIATAHQMDDNAETIIQRLARGTGIRGLGGIWPVREFGKGDIRFVRPMLGVTRLEVIVYLKERNLQWREDETNVECKFRRNYIRHRLLPAIQANCAGSLAEQLSALSRAARRYYHLVCRHADEAQPISTVFEEGKVILNCEKLLGISKPVQVELVRRALDSIGSGQRRIMQEHYERVMELAEQDKGGRKIELPGAFAARREYGNVILEKAEPQTNTVSQEGIEVTVPGRTPIGPYVVEARILEIEDCRTGIRFSKHDKRQEVLIERFDLANIKPPLIVRPRRDGDRFVPLGLQAEKKVGKFLTDVHAPNDLRRKVLVVEDREKVIWLWPIRMSEQAKVTDRTRKILQMEIAGVPEPDEGKETPQ